MSFLTKIIVFYIVFLFKYSQTPILRTSVLCTFDFTDQNHFNRSFAHTFCCLVFCLKAGSLCLVNSRRESYLLNTNKARAHLYGGAPVSFQTEKLIYKREWNLDLTHRSSSLNHWATAAILNMVKNFDFMYFNYTDFGFFGPNSTLQKFTFSCKFFSILRTYHIKLNKNIYKFVN